MNPQALKYGAYILLAAGILLLILTVILSIKFEIFQMLRAQSAGGSKNETADTETPEKPSVQQPVQPEKEQQEIVIEPAPSVLIEDTEPIKEEQPEKPAVSHNATVVISSKKKAPDMNGTVVVSNKKKNEEKQDDYVMIENILVIHGDPHIINI